MAAVGRGSNPEEEDGAKQGAHPSASEQS